VVSCGWNPINSKGIGTEQGVSFGFGEIRRDGLKTGKDVVETSAQRIDWKVTGEHAARHTEQLD
jgi:hypothetical protein